MITYITLLLWFIAGLCNGIMDAIRSHDAYKHWGYFWSEDSWQMSKWLNSFAPNAWHFLKYLMMVCFLLSAYFGFNNIFEVFVAIFLFMMGFNITYK